MKPNLQKLHAIARRINSREDTLEAIKGQAVGVANQAICEAMLQGQDLIAAKAECSHGDWCSWLAVHCPKVSRRTAKRYMALALKGPRVAQIDQAQSLREAMALCEMEGMDSDVAPKETKQWPPYMQALQRLARCLDVVTDNPITNWPGEGVDELRQQLQPIATQLWPERFA